MNGEKPGVNRTSERRYGRLFGKVAKGMLIVGTVLVILNCAEEAEAHGVVGAAARATRILGDILEIGDAIVETAELREQLEDEAHTALVSESHRRAAAVVKSIYAHIASRSECPEVNLDLAEDCITSFYAEVQSIKYLQIASTGTGSVPAALVLIEICDVPDHVCT